MSLDENIENNLKNSIKKHKNLLKLYDDFSKFRKTESYKVFFTDELEEQKKNIINNLGNYEIPYEKRKHENNKLNIILSLENFLTTLINKENKLKITLEKLEKDYKDKFINV